MKKVLLALVAGVVALLGVMVARTMMVPAPAAPAVARYWSAAIGKAPVHYVKQQQ